MSLRTQILISLFFFRGMLRKIITFIFCEMTGWYFFPILQISWTGKHIRILKITLRFGCPFWNISHLLSFSDILHYRKTQSMAGTKKKLCGTSMVMALFPCEDIQWVRYNPLHFIPAVLRPCSPHRPPVVTYKEDSYTYLFIPFHIYIRTLFSAVHRRNDTLGLGKNKAGLL